MTRTNTFVSAVALFAVLGFTGLPSEAAEETVDIWKAASKGNIEAIKQHLEAGTDVDAKESPGGSTPLLVAAVFGRTEAAVGGQSLAANGDGRYVITRIGFQQRQHVIPRDVL